MLRKKWPLYIVSKLSFKANTFALSLMGLSSGNAVNWRCHGHALVTMLVRQRQRQLDMPEDWRLIRTEISDSWQWNKRIIEFDMSSSKLYFKLRDSTSYSRQAWHAFNLQYMLQRKKILHFQKPQQGTELTGNTHCLWGSSDILSPSVKLIYNILWINLQLIDIVLSLLGSRWPTCCQKSSLVRDTMLV